MKKNRNYYGKRQRSSGSGKAMTTLDEFGVPYEVHVYSAHRTPAEAKEFAETAREKKASGALICAKRQSSGTCRSRKCGINTACYRHSCKVIYFRRTGCTSFHRADAGRHSCCNCCHRRSAECAASCGADTCRYRWGSCGKTGQSERKEAAKKVLEKNKAVEEKYNR